MSLTLADFSDPWETIYTFVDHHGHNTHIASARLRDWALAANLERFWVPLDAKFALQFIQENSISRQRCAQLFKELPKDPEYWEPLIFVHAGDSIAHSIDTLMADSALLVDGHHRYTVAIARELQRILGFCLRKDQWKPFEIVDNGASMTKEQLKSIPTIQRHFK